MTERETRRQWPCRTCGEHVVHGEVIYEMIFNETFPYSTVASVAMVTCKEPQCP